ncbi:Hsp70 family protein [Candidatus Pseudothioglobus singularis]|nr:Hsp70 family protein [Candidatus Pseudothioglobus singularis]MDA8854974.1 Hsp70 family protein [Candidatus Pseudothioglobus singularis]
MSAFLGIDLGTTNSAVSYINVSGRPEIILNKAGDNMTPSCLLFEGNEVKHAGKEARIQLGLNDQVIARWKREMGSQEEFIIDGHGHTPTTLSAELLKKIFEDAVNKIGEIEDVVITVPANFPHDARDETKKAAKLANINLTRIIDEPTAAALYHACDNEWQLNGNYMIYDLGGGTFDVSIVKIKDRNVDVICTDGNAQLGGDDFDQTLQEIVRKKYLELTGEELEEEDFTKTEAEDQKKSLSTRDVNIRVVKTWVNVAQDEFQAAISHKIKSTETICKKVLKRAKLEVSDIENIIFVGGSTRLPSVYNLMKKMFNKEPIITAQVDEAVALGASVYAINKGDQSKLNAAQKSVFENIKVQDVTPAYFGFICEQKDLKRGKYVPHVKVIIPKNINRPCAETETFFTMHDGQTEVLCSVTSSMNETTVPEFVTTIWEGSLGPLPKGRKKHQKINVTFKFDEDGIMHASFLDVSSGLQKEIPLSNIEENV